MMALFVPPVVAGALVGTAAYQSWNPPHKQAGDADRNLPRNLQDWRLAPQEDIRKIPTYWRNHIDKDEYPVEEAYRSTYNNIYTNGPKMMRDTITGEVRFIVPDGNSVNSTIIDHPGYALFFFLSFAHSSRQLRPGECAACTRGGPFSEESQELFDAH
jgi:hypothetical protein